MTRAIPLYFAPGKAIPGFADLTAQQATMSLIIVMIFLAATTPQLTLLLFTAVAAAISKNFVIIFQLTKVQIKVQYGSRCGIQRTAGTRSFIRTKMLESADTVVVMTTSAKRKEEMLEYAFMMGDDVIISFQLHAQE
jgi:hypothetical protein